MQTPNTEECERGRQTSGANVRCQEVEKKSIISKQDGSKPRKILIGIDYLNSIEEVKKNEHCK